MKKIIVFLGVCLILVSTYPFLPSQIKISLFSSVEKPWFRWRIDKPNSYLDRAKLDLKIKKDLPEWAKAQIDQDLSNFKKITSADLDIIYKKYNDLGNKLMRVQIKEGVLNIHVDHPVLLGYKSYQILEHIFRYIAENRYVLNADFILSLQDYVSLPSAKKPVPIFTFSKDVTVPIEKDLILMPDWMNFRSCAELIPRIKFANVLYPWSKKRPILFWRGGLSDSSGFRHELVKAASQYPALIDAKFFRGDNVEDYVSEERHVEFRYQMTIDGARATWERLVWQLHSNSLILKHKSNHIQWFYGAVSPDVHYVSVTDVASILKTMEWAEKNPDKANDIIHHAMAFAEDNLTLEDFYHYLIVLLNTYHARLF